MFRSTRMLRSPAASLVAQTTKRSATKFTAVVALTGAVATAVYVIADRKQMLPVTQSKFVLCDSPKLPVEVSLSS